MLRAVIFDLDETLISSAEAIVSFFRKLYDYIDMPFPEAEKEIFYTASEKGIVERLFPDPEKRKLADKFKREVYDFGDHTSKIELKPFAREAVEYCHGRYKLALATNRGDTTPVVLERFGFTELFEIAIHAKTLAQPKPHPIVIETILDTLQVEPEEIILVGDSQVDVETAKNGGIKCVIVGVHAKPGFGDYQLEDLSGLPGLLQKLENE